MRKLATIRKIAEIRPIEGADMIECAVVDGWTVVIKKGDFVVGDYAVYLEIDSWVPHAIAPFLSKDKEPREYEGVKGERLRTVKLRGQLSQGLLLRMQDVALPAGQVVEVGEDLTEAFGILKWERPIPVCMGGMMAGSFPGYVQKTDQERVQNLNYAALSLVKDWEMTEKLDGTSATYVLDEEGVFHVCSHNYEWKDTPENLYWQVAHKYQIEEKMRFALDVRDVESKDYGQKFLAVQGEIVGTGIQKNQYALKEHKFFVFDIQSENGYLSPSQCRALVQDMGLTGVPVLSEAFTLPAGRDELLALADGKSVLNDKGVREGYVFKTGQGNTRKSFKAVSNAFLLKGGD